VRSVPENSFHRQWNMGGLEMGKAGWSAGVSVMQGSGRQLIGRQTGSGLSVADFCRRESISTASSYRWRRLQGGASYRSISVVAWCCI
jgi:hypothetical protein